MAQADVPIHPNEDASAGLPGHGPAGSADAVGPAAARLSSLKTLGTTLWVTGQVLIFSYAVAVLTSIWPLQPLDPGWRLNAATNLVDNGGIPLVGMVLVHLAAQLDSRNQRRQAHRQRLARLALTAMTGFVLLIPLHVVSSQQLFEQLKAARVTRFEKGTYRLRNLRTDINAVRSHEELRSRLLKFQGQSLSPQDMAKPLPELKRQLNSQIQEAIRRIDAQMPPPGWNQALPMVLTNLRLGFTALGLAVGFAATGRRRGHRLSLLEETATLLEERRAIRQHRLRSRQAFLRSVEEAHLEQALLAEEEAQLQAPFSPDATGYQEPPPNRTKPGADPEAMPAPPPQNRRRVIDLDYFEQIGQDEQDADATPPPDHPSPP